MKDVIQNKSDTQLMQSLIAEAAKSKNEIECARRDLNQSENRHRFILVLLNELINRKGD